MANLEQPSQYSRHKPDDDCPLPERDFLVVDLTVPATFEVAFNPTFLCVDKLTHCPSSLIIERDIPFNIDAWVPSVRGWGRNARSSYHIRLD